MIIDHEDEDYWRNFGLHRETLIAPSLAWYGDNTQVLLAYEHREFLVPFDRGTAINPATNHPLDIPATRRPNDDPGTQVYYRLWPVQGVIVHKTHITYPFSAEKMARIKALFYAGNWQVNALPGYGDGRRMLNLLENASDLAEDHSEIGTDLLHNLLDRKSTRLNSSHYQQSRMPSSA